MFIHALRILPQKFTSLLSPNVLLTTKSCLYISSNLVVTKSFFITSASSVRKAYLSMTSSSLSSLCFSNHIHHCCYTNHNLNTSLIDFHRKSLQYLIIPFCCSVKFTVVLRNTLSTMSNQSYNLEERGARNSTDYRVYFSKLRDLS